jgi:hypothetical protein
MAWLTCPDSESSSRTFHTCWFVLLLIFAIPELAPLKERTIFINDGVNILNQRIKESVGARKGGRSSQKCHDYRKYGIG